ncbi:MAG: DUF58 domain-containing protein [Planctomycetota bacterium]
MLAKDIIRRVREIQVRTGRQVADVLAGEYTSVFKGRGIEFDEVRPYVPGDDVRSIDWNVTARMGSPFVKRYVEERQLTLMLLADVSASQDFGSATRSKREATAELCALLAFSANLNDDKVGLTLFHGSVEQYIPPRKGQRHCQRVVREVLAHGSLEGRVPEPNRRWLRFPFRQRTLRSGREATNLKRGVEFLLKVMKRRAIIFVVSDFFDDGYLEALQTANRKHDVVAVLVSDPREHELPDLGLVTLRDAETGVRTNVDMGHGALRRAFAARAAERAASLERQLRAVKVDFIHIDSTRSVVDPLVKFFRMRERRQRR